MTTNIPFVKHDTGKTRYDLLDPLFEEELAVVLTDGAKKYSADNWKRCTEPEARYYAALRRHLGAWAAGEAIDPESGRPHLMHAACCIMFMRWFERRTEAASAGSPRGNQASTESNSQPLDER